MDRLESLLRASRDRERRAAAEAIERNGRLPGVVPPCSELDCGPGELADEGDATLRFYELVHAFRAHERRTIREAVERRTPRPRLIAMSPALARRIFDRVGPNLRFEGIPVVIDLTLPDSEYRLR